jgi:hypothetical protein
MNDLTLPKTDEHVERGNQLLAQASTFAIESIEDMNLASDMREVIKDRQKAVTELLNPIIEAANKAHKAGTGRRKEILAPLEEAESLLNAKMIEYQAIEDGKRADEQKRLDEIAKNKAIAQAESEKNEGLAQAIKDNLVPVTAEPVAQGTVKGVSFTEKWTYEIEDLDIIPRQWMIPDEKAIKEHVTARKQHAKIAGIKVFAEKGIKSKPKGMTTRKW